MKTTTQVRDALISTLQQIKIANGYANDLPNSNIYKRWNKRVADDTRDVSFPKCFVVIEKGESEQRINEDEYKVLRFLVIIIVKKTASNDDPQEMVESYLNDLERLFHLDTDLSGAVNNVDIVEFVTDGGVLDPEGVVIFRLKTERYRHGNP